jgi:hypothetical protein
MARDDVAVFTDQDRVRESKRPNAAGDLGDLGFAMRSGIPRGGDQSPKRPELDVQLRARLDRLLFGVLLSHLRSTPRQEWIHPPR